MGAGKKICINSAVWNRLKCLGRKIENRKSRQISLWLTKESKENRNG